MLTSEMKMTINRLPKAELHCHLEGTIQPATLLRLANKNGIEIPFSDEEGAIAFYQFTGWDQFVNLFLLSCSVLKTADDLETITFEVGVDAAAQGIPYKEVLFTHSHETRFGISWEEEIKGIAAGRKKAKQELGVEMRFIADIDRTMEPEDGVRLVQMANDCREAAGIIGIGLDGPEVGFPAIRHKAAFALAKQLGFHRVAHAGEGVGSESVWDALNSLDAERIDHGVRSIDDPELVEQLAQQQIPLTVCPLSNVATQFYPNLVENPVKRLLDAGVLVTLNSDDPALFGSNLLDNYYQVAEVFNLSLDEVEKLVRNGFQATFLTEAKKIAYLQELDAAISLARKEIWGE
jgi:adenosine deaminase